MIGLATRWAKRDYPVPELTAELKEPFERRELYGDRALDEGEKRMLLECVDEANASASECGAQSL